MVFAKFIIIGYFYWTYGKPLVQKNGNEINIDPRSLDFLNERGYLQFNRVVGERVGVQTIVPALKQFQHFTGIEETGVVDDKTREYMLLPRCGKPDTEINEELRRWKRYVVQGTKWRKTTLTWALENSNNDGISDFDVRQIFQTSLDKWKSVTNIDFIELRDQPDDSADIRVRFGTLKHEGCQYPFDGKGNTLAHAFFPLSNTGLSGDVHYDDNEIFTVQTNAPRGHMKLLWITVHELGHSLGLSHSNKKGAIMFPYYQHVDGDDFNLTDDDILGIQDIYDAKVTPSEVPTSPTTTRSMPTTRKCTKVFKAAYLDDKKKFHVFNGNQHYVLDDNKGGVKYGPVPVDTHFESAKYVDTIFRRHTDRYLVVFHGNTFSVYNDKTLIDSPRLITNGFQNIHEKLQSIDAAFIWPHNKKLYIFKGEHYWRMTQLLNMDYIADFGYPKIISANWRGLPNTIDTAFKWINNKIYFTKDENYFRWDDRNKQVHSGYPQKLSRSFLKCSVV